MKTLFIIILLTVLSFSLQVIERGREHDSFLKQYMVQDDCGRGGGGGSSSSSSSSSSQSNKTKKFFVEPNFIQCLKDTTAVPISIINSISINTYIFMTEDYEYVTSGYSQMTLNKINARFKFCAIAIEGPPATTRACGGDYSCGNALGVTECFIEHLSELDGNNLKNAYDSRIVTKPRGRSGESETVVDDTEWKDQIVNLLYYDQKHFVNCLQDNTCVYYFGDYLGYYKC